jgi:glycogen debranching enzyme
LSERAAEERASSSVIALPDSPPDGLQPIYLGRNQLRGRNFLLGNKQGFMLHLPAANGAGPRTIHRSKWYGASRSGRKFFEGFVCFDGQRAMLSRRLQESFVTDGITARRDYVSGASESYFVPDYLSAIVWESGGPNPIEVHPLFDLRYSRSNSPSTIYTVEEKDDIVLLSREVSLATDAEGSNVSSEAAEPLTEVLCAACAVDQGTMEMDPPGKRWRPMWYSLDAARRRYLRRLAQRDVPVIEHAPMWELAAEWVYAPLTIRTEDRTKIALGFGSSEVEAASMARTALQEYEQLVQEKRGRLSELIRNTWFSCGHPPTDLAYSHVVSRLTDCLVIAANPEEGAPAPAGGPAILAGDAYFQEAWKRDENISLGGLLATGQYSIARNIIDSTWQRQDDLTGRLPLRARPGENPGYTSSDATLWALFRLAQYVHATGDIEALTPKLPLVAHFFRRSLSHVWQGLLPSGGVAIPGHDWETWMDTEFSSRVGFPIEIQLLWLICLREYATAVGHREPELKAAMDDASQAAVASLDLFRHGDYFVDHLTPGLDQVNLLTPNSYFWTILGLHFDSDWEQRSLLVGRHELAGISGVRTLARSQWESVLGPQVTALARRGRPLPSVGKANYHRGVEWNWLAQLFVAGELRHGRPDMAFDHYLARQIHDTGSFAGLGGISEVFDHRGPAGPDFQTWSMSGLLESLHMFAGVTVDPLERIVHLRPQKPRRWPSICARHSIGANSFVMRYESSRTERQITVIFDEELSDDIRLELEFILKPRQRPRHVRVRTEDGERVVKDWSVDTDPRRVKLTIPAQRKQQICLTL